MNGCDTDPLPPSRHGHRFIVGYAGGIYFDRDPRLLFRAAARLIREFTLKPTDFGIELLGTADSALVSDIAREEGVERFVTLEPKRPRREALEFLARATMLVSLPLVGLPQDRDLTIPAKIFEYVRFDAWVLALAACDSATGMLLRGSGADVVAPDDLEGIVRVLRDRFLQFRNGVRPRRIARDDRFSRRVQAKRLLDAIAACTNGARDAARTPSASPRVGAVLTAPVIHTGMARPGRRARGRVRVAYCIDNLEPGGTELNAVRTAERLDRSRFEVLVISLQESGPLAARYAAAGLRVIPLPIPNLYSAAAVRQGVRLARLLAEMRVQIVHSHDMYNNVFATVCARAARTPVIIASRRWWRSVAARRYRVANTFAFRLAHCVVANSAAVALSLQTEDGVRPDRIAVVPNFVDDAAFAPVSAAERAARRYELRVPADAFIVGIVANLWPVKDHATLLQAAARLAPRWPEFHVVLVGDGQCRQALESLTRTLGLEDRVHFLGRQPNEPNLHHLFDVSVLSSVSEGFPNSIVEAMAAARPVVATDVGGVGDAVSDGESGLLVPPSNPGRLAAAIEELLLDPHRRRALGTVGYERARARYQAAAVVASLEALYDRLLGVAAR
jgi:glycosyltransferase involved in cell wall biosynthesis